MDDLFQSLLAFSSKEIYAFAKMALQAPAFTHIFFAIKSKEIKIKQEIKNFQKYWGFIYSNFVCRI